MVAPQLLPIAMEYLRVGMKTQGDIFISHQGSMVLLLSSGSTVSEKTIERLENIRSSSRNIYVSAEFYSTLMNENLPAKLKQRHIEASVGYNVIKQKSKSTLKNLEENGEIEVDTMTEISDSITDKVNTIDASLLLQCVNGKNNVDEYFYSHCTNVAVLNGLMGKWMKLDKSSIDTLVLGGLLHDVGKTKIPSEILNAPRSLTDEEFAVMKNHSTYSYEMLINLPDVEKDVVDIALYHHERVNGKGYPKGLIADEIPLFARITAVSDVYDALVSRRCYKDGITPFEVLDMLSESKFSDLDFHIVQVLLENIPSELIGKTVYLSNGAIGKVKYVNSNALKYPLVDVQGEFLQTSSEVYCVSMTV